MIFNEMYVISLRDQSILKKYVFNSYGVNIILGVAKTDSNGVGKTAMVDAIRMLLGEGIPKDFKGRDKLGNKDILLVLKAEVDEDIIYFGRRIIDAENGFISNNWSMKIELWREYPLNDYREKIYKYMVGYEKKEEAPSFQALREYIIRDEKSGFSNIMLSGRKALQNSKCINFLALLPTYYEVNINRLKNQKTVIENEIKFIETLAKDIKQLKKDRIKVESEITKIKAMLDMVSVSEKIDYDEEKYIQAKKQLSVLERLIFKNELNTRQFEQNISNLEQRHNKVKELIDLKGYYEQIVNYFPEDLTKNYQEMEEFFDYMVANRGDYFKKRNEDLKEESERLQKEKKIIQNIISTSTQIFQNTQLVEDIHNINEQLNREYVKLADIKMKIEKYNEINQLTRKVNKKAAEILERTTEYEDDYKSYDKNIENIESHFKKLVNVSYKNEEGELTFYFENDVAKRKTTGRIRIECEIPDEGSHGRLYMKINMFDLSLFLNKVDERVKGALLIHDGSYCKPNPSAKANIIHYINNYLIEKQYGQYFITINKSELESEDLAEIQKAGMVIAEFDREHGEKNRFFGIRY